MSVLIISVLASRLSAEEAASLMDPRENWRTLLDPVHLACREYEDLNNINESAALRYCLSALWNLTDENPINCRRFVEAGGLRTYGKLLKVFRAPHEQGSDSTTDVSEYIIDYEGKILGLLNNVSEVPMLRAEIVTEADFITELVWRLHKYKDTERHYFAGGIIANVLNERGIDFDSNFEQLATELSDCVAKWEIPTHEHVAYRSFRPFIPLLTDDHCMAVRHWALWALGLVSVKNPERYAQMLKRDGIYKIICDKLPIFIGDELSKTLTIRLSTVLSQVDDAGLLTSLKSDVSNQVQ